MKAVTWEYICENEPRVKALYYAAKHVVDDKSEEYFCANYVFMNVFKPMIVKLVGFSRGERFETNRAACEKLGIQYIVSLDEEVEESLSTSWAYDTVYSRIYKALPDCRNCCCW